MSPMKFGGFLLANMLFCIWLGYLIDTWTGMTPVWIIVLTLYAIIGSFFILLWRKRKKDSPNHGGSKS